MSKFDKLLQRFLAKPKDFTYDELQSLLRGFGYEEIRSGRTSGSRVAFSHSQTKHIIRLHKPHPHKILKRYQVEYVENELKRMGVIT
jgi:hypothetical protein